MHGNQNILGNDHNYNLTSIPKERIALLPADYRLAIKEGCETILSLTKQLGIPKNRAGSELIKIGYSPRGICIDETKKQLVDCQRKGLTLYESWQILGGAFNTLKHIATAIEVEFPNYSQFPLNKSKKRKLLDRLDNLGKGTKEVITLGLEGLTLEQVGAKKGLTRERVRQIITDNGFYDFWREKRSEKESIGHE